MMEILIRDLTKQIAAAEKEEKDSQGDYEKFITESANKRSTDTLELESKEAAKAPAEETLLKNQGQKKASMRQLMTNGEYIKNLHGECDWLMQNFATRKEGRTDEVDSLTQAKDVLTGADYAF